MKISDQERVISFKRILTDKDIYSKLDNIKDEDLLIILDSAVLPNALSIDNLKYSLLLNYVFSKGKRDVLNIDNNIKNIKELFLLLSRTERDLLKYGYFYGFKYYSWEYVLGHFVKISSDPSKGKLMKQKVVSSIVFRKVFPFIYHIINKAEKNDRFPRL